MDIKEFSAVDIRVFLAEHLPYYEAEDKDDFLYIAKASDIERVALELYRHLTSQSSRPDNLAHKKHADFKHEPCSICFGCDDW